MNMMAFFGVYVVLGIIAQCIARKDIIRCIGNAMVGDTGFVFHMVNETTGEKFDYDASELSCDDDIVKNTITQQLDQVYSDGIEHRLLKTVLVNLAWVLTWPLMMPALLWFVHKHTDVFVKDFISEGN